jgi:hypothetical protein
MEAISHNKSFNEQNKELLRKIKQQEQRFESNEIELAFRREPDPAKKEDFLEKRKRYRDSWMELEEKILKNQTKNLKSLEPDLEKAIEELETQLQNVHNTVAILSTMNRVTSIVARVVTIV